MRALLIGSIAITLSGCTMMEAKPPLPKGDCDAVKAEAFIGRNGSAVAEEARTAAGAEAVRVIGPNQAVTMDYRLDRLNLDTDADGKVIKAHCG